MVRRPRIEVGGGWYQVYDRVASGKPIFADPREAVESLESVRDVKQRYG
jgi:hypothetical protein